MGCLGGKNKRKKGNEKGVRMSQSAEEKQREKLSDVKIVLLGDTSVGKSSLVQRFCSDKFEDKYKITIGGAYLQKEVKLKNGNSLKLHIWDTGGQEKFRSMAELYYKESAGALLVYDVSNKESLESLDYWIKEKKKKIDCNNYVICLAGNKCDIPNENKQVSLNQGKIFSKEHDLPIFYETSAKTGVGVKELFTALAQKVYEAQTNADQ